MAIANTTYIPLREKLQQKIAEVGTPELAGKQLLDDLANGRLSWRCWSDDVLYENSLPRGCSWLTAYIIWQHCTASWGAVHIAGPASGIAMPGRRKPVIVVEGIVVSKPSGQLDDKKTAMKNLLDRVVGEIPFPENRRRGWKTIWNKQASDLINAWHKDDPGKIKETTPGSVGNRMNEWERWP